MTSDLFPRRAVGSVVGIGGMAGAVGGMLIAKIVGLRAPVVRQLPAYLHHCRLDLSGGILVRAFARAAI